MAANMINAIKDCDDHIISFVINLKIGPTPIKIKFDNTLLVVRSAYQLWFLRTGDFHAFILLTGSVCETNLKSMVATLEFETTTIH